MNNVGQEWAWNFHFLDPAFLDAHEAEMIDLVLATYATHGRKVDRAAFMRAYCLGTAQMFVWGGGGLQLLMGRLHKRGLLVDLEPNDPRVLAPPAAGASHTDPAVHELLLGAEMTRAHIHELLQHREGTTLCGCGTSGAPVHRAHATKY